VGGTAGGGEVLVEETGEGVGGVFVGWLFLRDEARLCWIS